MLAINGNLLFRAISTKKGCMCFLIDLLSVNVQTARIIWTFRSSFLWISHSNVLTLKSVDTSNARYSFALYSIRALVVLKCHSIFYDHISAQAQCKVVYQKMWQNILQYNLWIQRYSTQKYPLYHLDIPDPEHISLWNQQRAKVPPANNKEHKSRCWSSCAQDWDKAAHCLRRKS